MIRLPKTGTHNCGITGQALAALLTLSLAGCANPYLGSSTENDAGLAGFALAEGANAAARKREEKQTQARKAENERLARKRARRKATEDIVVGGLNALAAHRESQAKCFAPKPEEAPGQTPLRRFMELSHEAEYGTGGGGGDGGGGC